ncbi:hypothetical protein C9374_004105 [Naegleria lovaniensis]|uniref:RIIa domain-containing protein n=1 Tax=Naegleria lovaniensis TaxID=51637 RepID=A0AA88KJ11_NAELO|nr:uncharacterized protein C9374_004105 [Naegleria lovaniensis]KAG2383434.1 hypothetical protein C9374_004105 [Naegleria lovaniensis]
MSHKYQKDFSLPPKFQETLRDFTREVLRVQPSNIYRFGYDYFTKLAKEMELKQDAESIAESNVAKIGELSPASFKNNNYQVSSSEEEVEEEDMDEFKVVHTSSDVHHNSSNPQKPISVKAQERFTSDEEEEETEETTEEEQNTEEEPIAEADHNDSFQNQSFEGDITQFLATVSDQELLNILYSHYSSFGYDALPVGAVKEELKKIFNYQLPDTMVAFCMAESDVADDSTVEIAPFCQRITNVLKIVVGGEEGPLGYSDESNSIHQSFLSPIIVNDVDVVHGLSKLELQEELKALFERAEGEGHTGALPFGKFKRELQEAELDLSRREINLLLSEAELDEHGQVVYENIISRAHSILFSAFIFDEFCTSVELSF